RRFWPIAGTVTSIDTDRLEREVDQLWAEAKAMYDAWRQEQPHGRLPLYLRSAEAAEEAKRLQESRRQETVEDTTAARIEHWLGQPINSDLGFDDLEGELPVYRDQVCLLDVWVEMMGRDMKDYDSRQQQSLGRAMGLVGGWRFSHRAPTQKYGRQRIFVRRTPR
ncbi:VapE domain-containing protein, partial [Brevundimonas sp.]|uniref:VapE domain-containing protein n=1 Tax=Brevundimonas sp. TaxID=1871086 RepID=UPI0035680341